MPELFHVFRGDCYGTRVLAEKAVKEWDEVFSGTKGECVRFCHDNPLPSHLCYVTVSAYKLNEAKERNLKRNVRYRSIVSRLKKDVNPGGIHRSYVPPDRTRRWSYIMSLENGTEGFFYTPTTPPKVKEGDEIIYELTSIKDRKVIKVKQINNEHENSH